MSKQYRSSITGDFAPVLKGLIEFPAAATRALLQQGNQANDQNNTNILVWAGRDRWFADPYGAGTRNGGEL
jgi:hypothetical protein